MAATSGASVLAKVYGLAEMSWTVPLIVTPCFIGLIIAYFWAAQTGHEEIATTLAIGFFAGLVSTIAYDLTRLPFHLAGYLVFVTNSTYGVWTTGSEIHSRYTELAGWLYHFSNGFTFAIMYALFMRGQHWLWAVVYSFALESICIFTHFGQVFSIAGNYGIIAIAYLAHVSYGFPLGLMVQHWERTKTWMVNNTALVVGAFAIYLVCNLIPLFMPEKIARDALSQPGVYRVDGIALLPFMQRLEAGGTLYVENPQDKEVRLRVVKTGETYPVTPGGKAAINFPNPGIFQLWIETEGATRSSFAIVEPVSRAGQVLAK